MRRVLITSALSLIVCGSATAEAPVRVNFEGLQDVRVETLDRAQVRPHVVFSVYKGVMLGNIELAFRTPDRSQNEFPLSDQQKQDFRAMLKQAFVSELAQLENPAFVETPGRDILRLRVRVQNVSARVPPQAQGRVGRAAIFLDTVGEVTLVLELFDSQSGEILARGVDSAALRGAAMRQEGGLVSTWDGVEELCRQWAATTRMRLASLVDGR